MLAVLWVASLVGWMVWGFAYPALLLSVVNVGFQSGLSRPGGGEIVTSAVESASRDLKLLAGVLARLEREQFAALHGWLNCVLLSNSKGVASLPPDRQPQSADGVSGFPAQPGHQIDRSLRTLDVPVPPARWKRREDRRDRPCAAGWKLSARLRPCRRSAITPMNIRRMSRQNTRKFHRVSKRKDWPIPCSPREIAVRNDVRFGSELRVLIISGPNMAGKSTFIRAVGINAVLAQCGAPVRAWRLRLSPLAVGASICVLDSLQGGISRFYAEIRRLKQIDDLTQEPHGSALFA